MLKNRAKKTAKETEANFAASGCVEAYVILCSCVHRKSCVCVILCWCRLLLGLCNLMLKLM